MLFLIPVSGVVDDLQGLFNNLPDNLGGRTGPGPRNPHQQLKD
jgi:hypothetical protein